MGYITEIGLTSRFFQGKGAYQLVYHKNSGTLPLKEHCRSILAILGFYYEKITHFLLILTLYLVFQLRHPFLLFHGPK